MIRPLFKILSLYFLLVSISLLSQETWTGTNSNDFNDGGNWSTTVPGILDLAIFPDVVSGNITPTISPGNSNAVFGLLFDAAANYTLNVTGISSNTSLLDVHSFGITNVALGTGSPIINITESSLRIFGGPVDLTQLTINANVESTIIFESGSVSTSAAYNISLTEISSTFSALQFNANSTCNGGIFNIYGRGELNFESASMANGGTFTLNLTAFGAGTINFLTDETVRAAVTVNDSSGRGTINITSTNSLIFNGTLSTLSASSFANGLTFHGGTTTFTSNSSGYLNNVNVDTGTLILTGTIGSNSNVANGSMTVAAGAFLEGTGLVGNNLILNGTVIPGVGGNVGTLGVGGNLSGTGGTYEAQIDASGQATLIDVGGNADVTDLNLDVTINSPPSITPEFFEIVSAGSVTAPFNTFNAQFNTANPLFSAREVDEPTAIFVEVFVPLAAFVENSNQFNVLNAFVSITNPNADQLVVLNTLAGLPPDQVANALDQVSGQQYTDYVEVGYNATNRFSNRLRMATRSRVVCSSCCGNDFFFWADAGGGNSDYSGDSFAKGLTSNNYYFSGGIQALNDCGLTLGAAASYEKDELDFKLNANADANIYRAALYTSYSSCAGYALANLICGCDRFHMNRYIKFGSLNRLATSHGKVWSGTFYGELGLTNQIGCVASQQYIGADAGYYYQKKMTERGAVSLDLNIDSTKNYRYDAIVGSRFQWRLPCTLSVELDLDYRHRFCDDRVHITTRLIDVDTPIKIKGFKVSKDGVEGSLTLIGTLCGDLQWYVRATGEVWSSYKDYGGTTGFIFHW